MIIHDFRDPLVNIIKLVIPIKGTLFSDSPHIYFRANK
jgi:hypothetical protein